MVTFTLRTMESILTNFKNLAKTHHDHSFTRVTDGLHKAIAVQESSILKNRPAKVQLICYQDNPNKARIFRIYMLENRKKYPLNWKKYPLNFLLQAPIFLQPELPHAFKKKSKQHHFRELLTMLLTKLVKLSMDQKKKFKMCYSVLMDFLCYSSHCCDFAGYS